MWVKMNQEQLNDMFDGLIAKRAKSQKIYFLGASAIMLGLAAISNMFFFIPLTPFLSGRLPTEVEVSIRILLVFVILELVVIVATLIDSLQFNKKDLRAKREYYYNNIKAKNTKICPKCGLIFDSKDISCTACGEALEMAADYMWLDDVKTET